MFDCIIVGSGVAGISAALTLQSNRKEFLIFGVENLSEKIVKAEKIHNYPGLSDVSGADFCKALQAQLQSAGIEIQKEKVTFIIRCVSDLVSDLLKRDTEYRITVRNETKVFPSCCCCCC